MCTKITILSSKRSGCDASSSDCPVRLYLWRLEHHQRSLQIPFLFWVKIVSSSPLSRILTLRTSSQVVFEGRFNQMRKGLWVLPTCKYVEQWLHQKLYLISVLKTWKEGFLSIIFPVFYYYRKRLSRDTRSVHKGHHEALLHPVAFCIMQTSMFFWLFCPTQRTRGKQVLWFWSLMQIINKWTY